MKSTIGIALLVAGALLAGPRTVRAQDDERPRAREGYRPLTYPHWERFLSLDPEEARGRKFSLAYLKFGGVKGDRVLIYGGLREDGTQRRSLLDGLLVLKNKRLAERMAKNEDARGNALEPRVTNMQVFGTVLLGPKKEKVLAVTEVRRIETFKQRYQREAAALKGNDADGRLQLIKKIQSTVKHFPLDRRALAALVEALRQEAKQVRTRDLPPLPGGADAWIKLGRKLKDIALLEQVWANEDVPQEQRLTAERSLRGPLNARMHLGKWLPYGEYMDTVGFVRPRKRVREALGHDRVRWVPKQLVWLAEASFRERRRQRREPIDSVPRGLLEDSARQGDVVRGMDKELVVAACKRAQGPAAAYPIRVERFREVAAKKEIVWELWVMQNGLRIFFFNGKVMETTDKQ